MSSGFILVSFEGPFSKTRETESVPRAVSLRRVQRILDGQSRHDWHERSGRYDDYDDAEAEEEGFGDHKAEREPTEYARAFGDYYGVVEGDADVDNDNPHKDLLHVVVESDADNNDPHEDFLHSIGDLSRRGKR